MNQAATDASNGQAFKPDSATCSHAAVQRRGPSPIRHRGVILQDCGAYTLSRVNARPGQTGSIRIQNAFSFRRVQRLPRFAINRHAAEIPFL